jgi:diphthamide synthase (EF-2-diphthine--ammonia ligase)
MCKAYRFVCTLAHPFLPVFSLLCRCDRLGLKSLAYLWERNQKELLAEMVDAGVHAILIKVAAMGLKASHLGKTIGQMYPELCALVKPLL